MGIRSEIFADSLFCVVDSFPTHKFADVNQPTEKKIDMVLTLDDKNIMVKK